MEIVETTRCCDGTILIFVDAVAVVVNERGVVVVETTGCVDDGGNGGVTLASVVSVDDRVISSTSRELMVEDTGSVGSIEVTACGEWMVLVTSVVLVVVGDANKPVFSNVGDVMENTGCVDDSVAIIVVIVESTVCVDSADDVLVIAVVATMDC